AAHADSVRHQLRRQHHQRRPHAFEAFHGLILLTGVSRVSSVFGSAVRSGAQQWGVTRRRVPRRADEAPAVAANGTDQPLTAAPSPSCKVARSLPPAGYLLTALAMSFKTPTRAAAPCSEGGRVSCSSLDFSADC